MILRSRSPHRSERTQVELPVAAIDFIERSALLFEVPPHRSCLQLFHRRQKPLLIPPRFDVFFSVALVPRDPLTRSSSGVRHLRRLVGLSGPVVRFLPPQFHVFGRLRLHCPLAPFARLHRLCQSFLRAS